MTTFAPRFDILPAAQRALWPELAMVPRRFVLYGGTAIALRLGHRSSVDFDFFSSVPFVPADLLREIEWLDGAEPLQSAPNTLTVVVERFGPVKVSFFGGLRLGRVGDPEATADGVLVVASLLDLAATSPEKQECGLDDRVVAAWGSHLKGWFHEFRDPFPPWQNHWWGWINRPLRRTHQLSGSAHAEARNGRRPLRSTKLRDNFRDRARRCARIKPSSASLIAPARLAIGGL